MTKWSSSWTQQVGYRKPPTESQFKPGRSGNPKGRPKGRRNAALVVAEILNEKVVISENEKKRTVTKLEAILYTWVARALKGDARALKVMIEMAVDYETQFHAAPNKMKIILVGAKDSKLHD